MSGLSGILMRRPVYDPKSEDVAATYTILNGTAASLPATGGVANSVLSTVASSSTGTALSAAPDLSWPAVLILDLQRYQKQAGVWVVCVRSEKS